MPDTMSMMVIGAGIGVLLGALEQEWHGIEAARSAKRSSDAMRAQADPMIARLIRMADDLTIRAPHSDIARAATTQAYTGLSVADAIREMGYRLEVARG